MATPPEVIRTQLTLVTGEATKEVLAAASQAPEKPVDAALDAVRVVVPAYYDAAGSLALAWYDERRAEARPRTAYSPQIIGDPTTDWIDREVAAYAKSLDLSLESEAQKLLDEVNRLAEKEVARGFLNSITGNTHIDRDAVGWSRIARPGACKFCLMIASRGAVFREDTATFAAHRSCHCAAQPEFRGGAHGPEASVEQYVASSKRRTPQQQAQLRGYLNTNFPDAPG